MAWPTLPCLSPGLTRLRASRSVAVVVAIPGTVPVLAYCQKPQLPQPAGSAGLVVALYAATHIGLWPKAVLPPVQVLHQPWVV